MIRQLKYLLFLLIPFLFSCKAVLEVVESTPAPLMGLEGLREQCGHADSVQTVLIRKADALFITPEERYETQVSVYAVRDSMIYFSAVNSGFEVLRGAITPDSIKVIDRINRIVYVTPVKRRFGYHHPVEFPDILNLVHAGFLCDDLEMASETDFESVRFDFSDPLIKKQIVYGRESLKLDKFEFYHSKTDKYLMGSRESNGFQIISNFVLSKLEVRTSGGEISVNEHISVKVDVNRRRYTFVNL